jgi:chromosome partitioning protein
VNEVLAPVSLEALTLDSLIEFQKSLIAVQGHHPNLQLKYVVPTFLDGRVKKSAEILLLLEKHFAALLCPSVRYSVRISEAPAYGQTIFEYAPSSTGAADYTALTEAVMRNGRNVDQPPIFLADCWMGITL